MYKKKVKHQILRIPFLKGLIGNRIRVFFFGRSQFEMWSLFWKFVLVVAFQFVAVLHCFKYSHLPRRASFLRVFELNPQFISEHSPLFSSNVLDLCKELGESTQLVFYVHCVHYIHPLLSLIV